MKKYIALILTLTLVLPVLNVLGSVSFAETDTPQQETGVSRIQASAMQKLMGLGIFSKTDADNMKLDQAISREEFAAILIRLNGQEDKLAMYRNSSFSDVPAARWSNPYIQVAVKMGYMTAMPDGKFHPTDKVSFSLAAVVFGRLLGYNSSNLTGSYPQNYLALLSNLGVLDDISWTASGSVTRGQMAVMILRLLQAKVYDSDKVLAETLPNYIWAIILENSVTNKDGDERRIVTDKGTFYLNEGMDVPQAGKRYFLRVSGREVRYACQDSLVYRELSVLSYSAGKVTTNEGEKAVVPAGVPFYYKGSETDYDVVGGSIQRNSSIIIGYDKDIAVYAALFDPLYSGPEVIKSLAADTLPEKRYGGITIEKNGKFISASGIELNDVLYKVTDIWGNHPYIIVYDNSVSGRITAILPSRLSPSAIEVDGTKYTLASSSVKEKLSTTSTFEVGKPVTLILDANGYAIDTIANVAEGTESYCLVLNAWTENFIKKVNSSTTVHYVTLLHSNGDKKIYITEESMSDLRGKLAAYEVISYDHDGYDVVRLTGIDNNGLESYKVNKDDRMINDIYVADGAVLFNILDTSTPEIQASVISFDDLPSGYLMDGKVKYIHRSGDFMDIDVMLLDDVLEENTAYGLVTRITSPGSSGGTNETITVLVNGKAMTYDTLDSSIAENSIVRVRLSGNSITNIEKIIEVENFGFEIENADSVRIKVNGRTYFYSKHLSIYKFVSQNNWKLIDPSELYKETEINYVAVYLDRSASNGGKVVAILIM